MTITHSSKIVTLFAGVAVAGALVFSAFATATPAKAALSQSQVDAIISLLQSFGADAATIANVQTSLTGGTPTTGGGSGGSTGSGNSLACYSWTRNLTTGSTGADVQALQQFLNSDGAVLASSGAGSPGNETTYFGSITRAGLAKWQAANAVSPAVGYFGPITRAAIAAKCGSGGTGGTPTAPITGSVSVFASAQPANSLAPQGASRVPFTNFTVSNGTNQTVTINSVTVERTGLGVDANFSGIVLIDPSGVQIGTSKTLNSNHQANVGDSFTLNPGESKTLSVAGNISSTPTSAGQIVSLSIVAINTSAPVAGSLPIVGASHTINTTLTLGSVSTTTSAFDPGAAQTKNIGDTGVRFAGLRFTADSAEDLRFFSIRWRQVGSASASDLGNLVTIVEGVTYPTVVSADGKYYTTLFPGGLLIPKGNSIDAYIMGDLVGSNSASRTVDFDIDRVTDVYFVGQTYGYGVAPSGTYTPWYTGYVTTINAGSATTIGKATEVAAQNVALNVNNQPLGGFVTDFRGEGVSITGMTVNFNYGSTDATGSLLTSVSIVNENGSIVAGPVDATDVAGTEQKATFTDTITFPTGRHVYTIKGKIPAGLSTGETLAASTTPSGWSSPTGDISGSTVTISQGNFTMNTMTIKAASLTVSLGSTPTTQSIVAGAQALLFATVQLDASQSGEDVRMSSLPLTQTGTITDYSSCQLLNGGSPLNTGSNVPSALAASGSATTFTFDNSLTIPKGTVLILELRCNLGTAASGTYVWSIGATAMTATGVNSGSSINVAETTGSAGTLTVDTASLTLSVDSSSPAYKLAAGGATGVTMSVFKLLATNEPLNLSKLGLDLTITGSDTSGRATDLTKVYIYDGATLVGMATFTGTSLQATSTLTQVVNLPKDTDKILTIKADLADIGTSQPGTDGALVKIDPDSAEASGSSSGTTVRTGAATGAAGVRVHNTYPVVALDTASCQGSGVVGGCLMRFTVTANSAGSLSLAKFSFDISTTTLTLANIGLYGYTDSSYSTPISDNVGDGNGQINTNLATTTSVCSAAYDTPGGSQCDFAGGVSTFQYRTVTNAVQVPAGGTRYFELRATVTGSDTGASAVTVLKPDTAFATTTVATHNAVPRYFVWSPNATTTTPLAGINWSPGYNVPGFPASGLINSRSH